MLDKVYLVPSSDGGFPETVTDNFFQIDEHSA